MCHWKIHEWLLFSTIAERIYLFARFLVSRYLYFLRVVNELARLEYRHSTKISHICYPRWGRLPFDITAPKMTGELSVRISRFCPENWKVRPKSSYFFSHSHFAHINFSRQIFIYRPPDHFVYTVSLTHKHSLEMLFCRVFTKCPPWVMLGMLHASSLDNNQHV